MSKKINFTITVLAVVAVLLVFVTSGEPLVPCLKDSPFERILSAINWPNTIVFNLSVGYLSSTIFWLLVVYLPEKSRRSILREGLANRYKEFKCEIVQTFIDAAGEAVDSGVIEDLASNHTHFKQYFESDDRWYAVLNGIQSERQYMQELQIAMQMLADEVEYILNNVPIDDPSVYLVFKNLNVNIFRLRECETDLYNQVKHVGQFLKKILARWDFVEGQLEDDIIEKMIVRI